MVIPLSKPYMSEDIKNKVLEVMDSGQYILHRECRKFENEFAEFIGVKHAVLTSSGTSAIFLTLKSLGVGPGDSIIVPSLTAFPTIEPILHLGASPMFVDIDDTFTIDINYLKTVLDIYSWAKIKGIIPVHLYGHPADMEPIMEIVKQRGMFVLEDCCQAHGALYKSSQVGSMGMAGCFSFYPSKNMTVFGDGGMIVTSDDKIAEECRMLRDHGRKTKYLHEIIGYNMRCNEIQAAIGRIQLEKLSLFNKSRRQIAQWYNSGLIDVPVITPKEKDWACSVYHLYVIQTPEREKLAAFLKEKGIQTGIHYPVPNHLQPAIVKFFGGARVKLAKTEEVVGKVLSLPMYPELKKEEVDFICDNIKKFFGSKNGKV